MWGTGGPGLHHRPDRAPRHRPSTHGSAVAKINADDAQRRRRLPSGGPVRLQEPTAGGERFQCLGDPDSAHTVWKDGGQEVHGQGEGVLRQEEHGATDAEGVAANPSDFLGVNTKAISDARNTALQRPSPRNPAALGGHDTCAGRGLCRVPVQAVHGGEVEDEGPRAAGSETVC